VVLRSEREAESSAHRESKVTTLAAVLIAAGLGCLGLFLMWLSVQWWASV